jgi:hypothetical protein
MDLQATGRILILIGIGISVLGGLFLLLGRLGVFGNLGHLPGDIRIERQGITCLVPITSAILISIILTAILNILVRIINRQ